MYVFSPRYHLLTFQPDSINEVAIHTPHISVARCSVTSVKIYSSFARCVESSLNYDLSHSCGLVEDNMICLACRDQWMSE